MQDSQSQAQPDELIDFHHLKARRGMSQIEIEDQVQTDLQRATGLAETGSENAARLNRVLQLTGALLSPAHQQALWHSLFSGSPGQILSFLPEIPLQSMTQSTLCKEMGGFIKQLKMRSSIAKAYERKTQVRAQMDAHWCTTSIATVHAYPQTNQVSKQQ